MKTDASGNTAVVDFKDVIYLSSQALITFGYYFIIMFYL